MIFSAAESLGFLSTCDGTSGNLSCCHRNCSFQLEGEHGISLECLQEWLHPLREEDDVS